MVAHPYARGLLAWKYISVIVREGQSLKESPKPVKNKDWNQINSISEASVGIPKCDVVCD